MDLDTKKAIASALHEIARLLLEDGTLQEVKVAAHPDPSRLFDIPAVTQAILKHRAPGDKTSAMSMYQSCQGVADKPYLSGVPNPSDPKEMNAFWFEKLTKPHRKTGERISLNHRLNRVNVDWENKNVRTPVGDLAILEVAADVSVHPETLAYAMLMHPRFGRIGSAFYEAALAVINNIADAE